MIAGRRVLAVIPARGGSKGLPGKNILPVNGRPLLAWTADAARASRYVDEVVLSSEDDAIIEAGRACGCAVPFRRPLALADDSSATIDVVLHALDCLPTYEIVVVLQPTSPLRTAHDIDAACERMIEQGAPSCVSICVAEQHPYWMYRLDERQLLSPIIEAPQRVSRRQDLPTVYVLNGAVYVAEVDWLRRSRQFVAGQTAGYVMPLERSIDIDTAADFEAFRTIVTEDVHV
jgi:N-acylneuraminate cytidylyltransferase